MKQYRFLLFFMGAMALMITSSALAAPITGGTEIGIDFGATASAPATNFNDAGASLAINLTSLQDTSGVAVDGVSFTVGNNAPLFSNSDAAIGAIDASVAALGFDATHAEDFMGFYGQTPNVMTLTFSGLDDSLSYEFVGVSAFDGRDLGCYFESGNQTAQSPTDSADPYGILSGLLTDGSGNLVIRVLADADVVVLNTVKLTASFELPPHNPAPADDPDGSGVKIAVDNVVLSWNTALGSDAQPLSTVKKHYILGTFANPSDPNLYLVDEVAAGDPVQATASYIAGALSRDEVYKWQIVEGVDDGQGGVYAVDDPNNIVGPVWTFYTALSIPEIDPLTPADQFLAEGEEAVFSVSVINPYTGDSTGLEYQWYENDVLMSGEESATLTLSSVTGAQDGNSYYCKVTITANGAEADSGAATLILKKLMIDVPFDNGDPNDKSPNAYSPVVEGAPTYEAGKVGQAVRLNGTDDRFNYGDALLTDSGEITVSYWMNPDDISEDWGGVMCKWLPDVPDGYFWIGQHATNGWLRFELNGIAIDSGTPVLEDGVWAHIVASYDGDEATLYINGVRLGSVTGINSPFVDKGGDFMIGSVWDAIWYGGLVDEVKVYNYVRSATQVAEEYSAVMGPYCVAKPAFDLTDDCQVNIDDLVMFAGQWLDCAIYPTCIQTLP